MMTDIYKNPLSSLTAKQYGQLINVAKQVQPYLPFKEVAFIELLKIARVIMVHKSNAKAHESTVRYGLAKFKSKYYVYGLKVNKQPLTGEQHSVLTACIYPRMAMNHERYNPIERDVFVMLFRACKKYVLTGMTKESEDMLIERLLTIANIMG